MTRDLEAQLSGACIAVTHVVMQLAAVKKGARVLTDKHRAMLIDAARVMQLGAELLHEFVTDSDAEVARARQQ